MVAAKMSARANGIIADAHNLVPPDASNLPKWLIPGIRNGTFSRAAVQGFQPTYPLF